MSSLDWETTLPPGTSGGGCSFCLTDEVRVGSIVSLTAEQERGDPCVPPSLCGGARAVASAPGGESAVVAALYKAKGDTGCLRAVLEGFHAREEAVPLLGVVGGAAFDSLICLEDTIGGGILVAEFESTLNFFVFFLLLFTGEARVIFGRPVFRFASCATGSVPYTPSPRRHFLLFY